MGKSRQTADIVTKLSNLVMFEGFLSTQVNSLATNFLWDIDLDTHNSMDGAGEFTVPVTGNYICSVNLVVAHNAGRALGRADLEVNSINVRRMGGYGEELIGGTGELGYGTTYIAPFVAGDVIRVRSLSATATEYFDNDTRTTLSILQIGES